MINKFAAALLFSLSLALFISCEEIPSLSATSIHINSPYDGATFDTTLVTFSWQPSSRASYYKLLVSRAEENQNTLILDTVLYSGSYKSLFSPGNYFWQVQALNATSATSSEQRIFSIDTTLVSSNVWNKNINILAPTDSSVYASDKDIIFMWELLDRALKYELTMVTPSFDQPTKILTERTLDYNVDRFIYHLNDSTLELPLKIEWKIRAKTTANSNSTTIYSPYQKRTVYIVE